MRAERIQLVELGMINHKSVFSRVGFYDLGCLFAGFLTRGEPTRIAVGINQPVVIHQCLHCRLDKIEEM